MSREATCLSTEGRYQYTINWFTGCDPIDGCGLKDTTRSMEDTFKRLNAESLDPSLSLKKQLKGSPPKTARRNRMPACGFRRVATSSRPDTWTGLLSVERNISSIGPRPLDMSRFEDAERGAFVIPLRFRQQRCFWKESMRNRCWSWG